MQEEDEEEDKDGEEDEEEDEEEDKEDVRRKSCQIVMFSTTYNPPQAFPLTSRYSSYDSPPQVVPAACDVGVFCA